MPTPSTYQVLSPKKILQQDAKVSESIGGVKLVEWAFNRYDFSCSRSWDDKKEHH